MTVPGAFLPPVRRLPRRGLAFCFSSFDSSIAGVGGEGTAMAPVALGVALGEAVIGCAVGFATIAIFV